MIRPTYINLSPSGSLADTLYNGVFIDSFSTTKEMKSITVSDEKSILMQFSSSYTNWSKPLK